MVKPAVFSCNERQELSRKDSYDSIRFLFPTTIRTRLTMIKHIVLFKIKDTVMEDQVQHVFSELAGLKDLIPGLLDFSGGPYSSPEGLNKEFTHGFIMTFKTAEDPDIYLPHPEHERVKELVIPCVDDVVAFDFED